MKKLILLTLVLTSVLHAAPVHKTSYHWYDGSQKKTVWINAELVGEFDETSVVQPSVQGAQQVRGQFGTTRIWRLPKNQLSANVASRMRQQHARASVSPVFHDRNTPKAAFRALPGDVIVVFKPTWSDAQIKNWLSGLNLQVVEKMTHEKNAYLVQSAPGLASIATANRIYETGQVVSSSPNWWSEREAK